MAYDQQCRDAGKDCPRILTYSTPAPVMGGMTAWGVPPARGDGAYNREILCRNAPGIVASIADRRSGRRRPDRAETRSRTLKAGSESAGRFRPLG